MTASPRTPETPPECGPTVERLQAALDAGDLFEPDADPHALVCAACRGRIRAARLLLAALANPESVALPPNFADRVLADVRPASRLRNWRVVVSSAIGIAAAVLVAVWSVEKLTPEPAGFRLVEMVERLPSPTTPAPKPLRINDEIAKAGQAILDTARPLTEPATTAPRMFASLSNPFAKPASPAVDLEPARRSLADIPDAARAGFEPIAGSASKAFARLVRDVSAVQPGKPKS